ncbi:hypothetical protein GQN54_06400 [Cryomorphaceae bacterium S-15]|uniref:Uncharacterized protein n=2 Tax=Acidiluteibacter ferrifornacis TaxID=2692424 RepID=A0A6N9NJT7_9FLAO|nr:hypothetical protein [Acidiluteibacter ferrifornacis]
MSKRELKIHLKGLKKAQLEAEIIELYDKFKAVKVYYDFSFNPKERQLIDAAKGKIYKEYFPNTKRKAKARRSIAQKSIQHFLQLGMDPTLIADLMCYNIEVAQLYCAEKKVVASAFYKSMLKSYNELIGFVIKNGITTNFAKRIHQILLDAQGQGWENYFEFEDSYSELPL